MAEDTEFRGITRKDDGIQPLLSSARSTSCRKWIAIGVVGVVLVVLVILTVVLSLDRDPVLNPDPYDKAKIFEHGAVASDSNICSKVGAKILEEGGNAVDSAIASVFCLGAVNLHSCGIGGGGFFVAYIRATKKHVIYDYREEAPASATEDMYVNSTKSSTVGGSSVAVPGQVKGLWTIHKNHGKMEWAKLLQPAIDIAENGFSITKTIDTAMDMKIRSGKYKSVDMGLRKLLSDGKGGFLKLGDTLRNPALGRTLRNIQKHNATDFYEGELARNIVKDIRDSHGNITLEDLKNYKVRTRDPVTLKLPHNMTLTAMGPPSGGAIVSMILNIMSGYDWSKTDLSNDDDLVEYYQKLIESMKFSYAQRGYLGDPSFLPEKNISKVMKMASDLNIGKMIREKISLDRTHQPSYYGGSWADEDFGTAHLSVLAPNGDAVAVTETINLLFGSLVYSEETGIIYNDEMDDFSTPGEYNAFMYPPSPANFIRPGKRPLSSMSPTIVTDSNGDVKMVCGASGGSRIITGTAQVLMKKLFLNQELGEAVSSFRVHDQGIPNEVYYSTKSPFKPPSYLLDALRKIGHVLNPRKSYLAVVQAIFYDGEKVYAKSDPRKGGEASGF